MISVRPGRSARTLAGLIAIVAFAAGPSTAVAGGSGQLAFVRATAAGGGLFSIRADGRELKRLSSGRDEEPAWSPDGSRLAFSRSRDSGRSYQIFVATRSARWSTYRDSPYAARSNYGSLLRRILDAAHCYSREALYLPAPIEKRSQMLNTILWATDGSENAARALPWAKELLTGAGDDAMLIAVHIVQEPASVDRAKVTSKNELLANVQNLVAEGTDEGLKIALKVANYVGSQPAQAIADIAREVDADVIVVGTRGHSRVGGLIVGSVAQNLLKLAPCPVLSVPPGSELTVDERVAEAVRAT